MLGFACLGRLSWPKPPPLAATVLAGEDERSWDGVVGAINSCDDLIAPEVEVEGILAFLRPVDCGTPKVRGSNVQCSTAAVVVEKNQVTTAIYVAINIGMFCFKTAVWY